MRLLYQPPEDIQLPRPQKQRLLQRYRPLNKLAPLHTHSLREQKILHRQEVQVFSKGSVVCRTALRAALRVCERVIMELLPKSVRRRLWNQVSRSLSSRNQAVLTLVAVVTAEPSESDAERFLPVEDAMLLTETAHSLVIRFRVRG